jgi:hypothetical protein
VAHLLTFSMDEFIEKIVADDGGTDDAGTEDGGSGREGNKAAKSAALDLFARLTQRTDNRGQSDEHRAANYVALRYQPMYRLAAEAWHLGKSLVDVQLRRGPAGARRTVAVRLVFRSPRSDVIERYQCMVDVTDRFPYLTVGLSPIFD